MQARWAAPRRRQAHDRQKRERRVELAAAEAAEEDPEFAPDNVRATATQLFLDIQNAWDRDDRTELRGLVGSRPAGRMGAPAGRLRAPRLAQPRGAAWASRASSTSA